MRMHRLFRRLAFSCLAAAGFALTAGCQPVDLIQDGQPRALIVLPSKAAGQSVEAGAAKILADHLFLISGARLQVKRESDLGAMKVEGGRLAFAGTNVPAGVAFFVLVGESEAARALGFTSEGLGPGGILVKTGGNVLALLGPSAMPSDPGGTRHAVIEFLETLGVRYLWPGETGRVIPRMTTVSIGPLDRRFTPSIGQRNIRFMGMGDRPASSLPRLHITMDDWTAGARKAGAMDLGVGFGMWHRLGGNIGIGGGHAGAGLSGGWKAHGEKHPEWFALQADGSRDQGAVGDRWRLCKSNPELIKFVADSIIERANKDPNLKCVSLSPNDGGYSSYCMCENCRKLDAPDAPKIKFTVMEKAGKANRHEIDYVALTDRMVWYWNQIAERVTKVHPNLLFLGDAYSYYSTPPVREKLHPNLVIRYVPSGIEGWENWQKAGCKRIYWRPNILLAGRRDGKLHVMVQRLADTMGFMADRGMLATDFDSVIHNWAVNGLNYYAAARLNWNPHLTAGRILDEYCSPGFGPGAEHVKRYFLAIQDVVSDTNKQFTVEGLASLRSTLASAEKGAAGDKAVCDRIAFLRLGLNFTELQVTLDALNRQAEAKDPALDRERVKRLLELHYATLRDIVRNHSTAIHAPYLLWASGDFARWSAIGGRGYRLAQERIEQADADRGKYTLTGRENSLDEMIVALGLDRPVSSAGVVPRPAVKAGAEKTVMEADEQGRPTEMPAR